MRATHCLPGQEVPPTARDIVVDAMPLNDAKDYLHLHIETEEGQEVALRMTHDQAARLLRSLMKRLGEAAHP